MKRINVVIADDEKIVREGLSRYVDWNEYNMQVIATAENGEAAFKIIQNEKVDLLITDIYMPLLDGMTLIRNLEERADAPLVILISGFGDFNYAQTAIRSSIVQDYILKPIDFDRIDFILGKVRDKIMTGHNSVQFPILSDEEWKIFTSTSATAIITSQNEIISRLETGDLDNAINLFEYAIEVCRGHKRSHNFISRYCIELTLNICEFALDNFDSVSLLGNDPIGEISKKTTENEVFDYVRDIMIKTHKAMRDVGSENLSPIIKTVLKYIHKNYGDCTLSLNRIADDNNISASYLSNKFKEEVNINFIKYVNGLRIKKAKEFLHDISLKVFMVSSRVGYEDVRYFSRIFRKYTGYTPGEYQKKVTQFTLTE